MDVARIPFTPEDEEKIASAATWGSIVAITSIVGGGISLVTAAMTFSSAGDLVPQQMLIPILASGIFIMIINVWLLQACAAFRKVALTDEADQAYLLAGFRKLKAYFVLQVVMILVMLALGLMGAFAAAAMF